MAQRSGVGKPKKPQDTAAARAAQSHVPHSRHYVELRELDLRVEQYSNRQKAEIADLSQDQDLTMRCLRLQFFNRHYNQGSSDPSLLPSWTFYICGTFVDHNQGTGDAASAGPSAAGPSNSVSQHPLSYHQQQQQQQQPKITADRNWTAAMSSVQLRIEDPSKPDEPAEVVRWERHRHTGQHKEQIEFHRLGAAPARIYITMVRDFAPPYKRITGTLADALKLPGGSPGQVRRALEKYATAHSTPDTTDPSIMHADRELEGLVGAKRITTAQLQSCVDAHLQPLDPVSLDYTVKLDGPSLSAIMCHDVQVGWPLKPAMLKLPPYLERLDIKGNLEAYDEKILEALATLKNARRKHRMLLGFATDPNAYICKFVAASAKEVCDRDGTPAELSAPEHYKQPWAQEAAAFYLQKLDQGRQSAAQLSAQQRANA